jgi:uncharacterized protein
MSERDAEVGQTFSFAAPDCDRAAMPSAVTIVGASARAAAYSALRAGLTPSCLDLFADADLRAAAESRRVPPADYPHSFLALLRDAPAGPVVYTGGLENHPQLIAAIANDRPVWGNHAESLRRSRDPFFVCQLLDDAGLLSPRLAGGSPRAGGDWLRKPFGGAGGADVSIAKADELPSAAFYHQQFVPGPSYAAVFCALGDCSALLGVTEQLVGEEWLNAQPFQYCGSIGPVDLQSSVRDALKMVGEVLRSGCGLRGLFGIDFILNEGRPWPVDVNPRYTASMEVLEHATGLRTMAYQRAAFDPSEVVPELLNVQDRPPTELCRRAAGAAEYNCVGKAVVFASRRLVVPSSASWPIHTDPFTLPDYADIPYEGETIEEGWPIMTVFARGSSNDECRDRLRERTLRVLESLR